MTEVERLREGLACRNNQYAAVSDELEAHRAIIAELRRLCSRKITDPAAQAFQSVVQGELDKLSASLKT